MDQWYNLLVSCPSGLHLTEVIESEPYLVIACGVGGAILCFMLKLTCLALSESNAACERRLRAERVPCTAEVCAKRDSNDALDTSKA